MHWRRTTGSPSCKLKTLVSTSSMAWSISTSSSAYQIIKVSKKMMRTQNMSIIIVKIKQIKKQPVLVVSVLACWRISSISPFVKVWPQAFSISFFAFSTWNKLYFASARFNFAIKSGSSRESWPLRFFTCFSEGYFEEEDDSGWSSSLYFFDLLSS